MKRIPAVLLSLLLLACGVIEPQKPRADLPFSELTGSGSDPARECAKAEALLDRIERGELNGAKAQAALDARREALELLCSDAALCYVQYCFDVTDAEKLRAYDALCERIDSLRDTLAAAERQLKKDPSDRLRCGTGDAIGTLRRRERALVARYAALPATLFVPYGGRRWTGDAILSDPSLSEADFAALYEAYTQLFHAEASAIFRELIKVRNAIAEQCGFDACPDRAYCGGDVSREDAEAFSARVKAAFSPLLQKLTPDFFAAAGRLYGVAFQKEETIARVGEAICVLLPELQKPWEYMIGHGLYDFGTGETRMPGSFTTYFAAYGAPFLFGEWTGGFDMPPLIAHEFGHYASLFRNGDVNKFRNRSDLAEFDAQGLELLIVLRYDTLYGNLRNPAETAALFYAVYTLLSGCMEEAFERFAYGGSDVNAQALDAEYARLLDEYGLSAFGIDPRSWTQSARLFQTPFSGIGYALGAAAALELYLLSRRDAPRAIDAYRAVLFREADAAFGETLKRAGLSDPVEPGTLERTAYELGSARRNSTNE